MTINDVTGEWCITYEIF